MTKTAAAGESRPNSRPVEMNADDEHELRLAFALTELEFEMVTLGRHLRAEARMFGLEIDPRSLVVTQLMTSSLRHGQTAGFLLEDYLQSGALERIVDAIASDRPLT